MVALSQLASTKRTCNPQKSVEYSQKFYGVASGHRHSFWPRYTSTATSRLVTRGPGGYRCHCRVLVSTLYCFWPCMLTVAASAASCSGKDSLEFSTTVKSLTDWLLQDHVQARTVLELRFCSILHRSCTCGDCYTRSDSGVYVPDSKGRQSLHRLLTWTHCYIAISFGVHTLHDSCHTSATVTASSLC